MKAFVFYLLVLLHNLVMTFFLLLNSFVSHSSVSQIMNSTFALAYWITGWVILFRKRKLVEA